MGARGGGIVREGRLRGIVAEDAARQAARGLHGLAVVDVGDEGLIVEGLREGEPHVLVREEIGRDAGAVEAAGADERVGRRIDLEVEVGDGLDAGAREILAQAHAGQTAQAAEIPGVGDDLVGVAALEQELARGELGDRAQERALEARGLAVVGVVADEDELLRGAVPALETIGSAPHGRGEERGVLLARIVEARPGGFGAVPAAVRGRPGLGHARRVGRQDREHGRVGLGQAQDEVVPFRAHGANGAGVEIGAGRAVLVPRGADAEQRLEKDRRGAAVAVLKDEADDRVADVFGGQRRAVRELDAAADRDPIGEPVGRDQAVGAAGHARGQERDEFRPVVVEQSLVDRQDHVLAGELHRPGRVERVGLADVEVDERVGVFRGGRRRGSGEQERGEGGRKHRGPDYTTASGAALRRPSPGRR
jgi:hypothetical protein